MLIIVLLTCLERSSAFHQQNSNSNTGRNLHYHTMKRLRATHDTMCPEIPLTPRPGNEMAVVASG
jgi:hypothetical protein